MASLGRIELMAPEDLDSGMAKYNIYEQAIQTLAQRGLYLPNPPTQAFAMPGSLTQLDDNHLGDLLNQATQWCAYVESELAQAKVLRNQAKAAWEFVQARVRIGIKAQSDEKLTNSDKDDRVGTDPRVTQAELTYIFHDARYEMAQVLVTNAQRDWDTVSRRITQRGQEVERMKREGNVGAIPTHGTFMRNR